MTAGERHEILRRRDVASHLHPQTNAEAHEEIGPTIIAAGDGCWIVDDRGNRYLDMHSGLWCATLGMSEHRLARVAAEQFARLPYGHTFGHRSNEPAIELAAELVRLAPVPMSKAMFQSSGSEANDTAVKIAWYYWAARGMPARRKIIARANAYHGTTAVAASLTHLPHMHARFGLPLPGFLHVPGPDLYRGPQPGETEDDYVGRLLAALDETIEREGAQTIAAFIAEPVTGAGGIHVPPASYFPRLQEVLHRHGILLIADEVICGFGRTGNWWGSQTCSAKPDIVTCAKGLSAAYLPISAVLIDDAIYDVLRRESGELGIFGHGFTYGGHPVCAAVAREAIRIYRDDGLIAQAARKGEYLKARLARLADHPLVGDIRGVGLMWGVEIVSDKERRLGFDPALKIGHRISSKCFSMGVNTRPLQGHTMAFTPPLIVCEEEMDFAVDVLEKALDETYSEIGKDRPG